VAQADPEVKPGANFRVESACTLTLGYAAYMDHAEISKRLEQGSGYTDLPGRHVTMNQLVAYNLAYWRKVAGLTQEEFGERIGWSKAAVSAAERAWDGKRTREFNADLLIAIVNELDLPLAALFLPPEDDGIDTRYVFHNYEQGDWCHNMYDLMSTVMSEPSEDTTEVMKRYRERYTTTVNFYLGESAAAEVAQYVEDLTTEELIVDRLARARTQYEALRGILSDIDKLQEELSIRLREMRSTTSRSARSAPSNGAGAGPSPGEITAQERR
jgi:transcriptional regulator with XRE-family HTH domain